MFKNQKENKNKQEIVCRTCGKKFPNDRNLKQHEIGKHKLKKYGNRKK
jgi:hypothetical protein